MKAKPYSGELAKPIAYIPPRGLSLKQLATLNSEQLYESLTAAKQWPDDAYTEAMVQKLPALFAHFSVPPGNFMLLTMALAHRYVPGFKFAKAPAGARPKWTPWQTAMLRFHIDEVCAQMKTPSIAEAARRVAKSKAWAPLLRGYGNNPGETLRRRAHAAIPNLVEVCRSAYRRRVEVEAPDHPPTIEEYVREMLALNSA